MDSEVTTLPSISLSIVLSRQKREQNNPRVAVAACLPRKRNGLEDTVRFSLVHYSFYDDARAFTNLDALLNRLGKVNLAAIGCTETIEAPPKCNNSALIRKISEAKKMLDKITATVSSTGCKTSTHNLPRNLISDPTGQLDSYMQTLLGNETTPQHLAYRGNKVLCECHLSQLALCLLIREGCDVASATASTDVIYEVSGGALHSHLNIDGTASECINLLPPKNSGMASLIGGNSSNNSLYGVLNQTKTKMGGRLLEVWLRQPLVDLKKIEERLDVVELLVQNSTGSNQLRGNGLRGLCDLDRLCSKLLSSNPSLEDLYQTYLFADQQLPAVVNALEDIIGNEEHSGNTGTGLLSSSLAGLKEVCLSLNQLKELAHAVLDFESIPMNYLVRPEFDERLVELKVELDNIEQELKELHQNMDCEWSEVSGKPTGQVRLETVTTTTDKDESCCWQFRLPKTNDEKTLRTEFANVYVHRILKSGVFFSTKELRELGTQKQDVKTEYSVKQKSIVDNAMSVAATYVPLLEKACASLAELDVLASFAHVAAYSPNTYCRPRITDSDGKDAGIVLRGARHPCVELQEGMEFIPNDFDLVYGSSSFTLLTGPNMGGKSTYIRSLGAIVTMAQVGSFVPADSATVNIVDKILARVGAGDVQQRGISTFMAEMLEASSILQRATKRSLIIIDELGRGTSTFDGFGLAWAISEYIVKKVGAITVFATHFHELTRLEETEASVKNFHVTAQRCGDGSGELTFLYEVRPGPCLESFGIQVAEMANVPPTVIAEAKRKAKELENFSDADRRKRRTLSKESESFADKFKSLPFKTMSSEEKIMALRKLLQ